MTYAINMCQPRSARGLRRDGGSVFPSHANPGDPNGPVSCPSNEERIRADIHELAVQTSSN